MKSLFNGVVFFLFIASSVATASQKIVIAHRGASGYLPEHSLAAKAMAYAMGADYIEQDVVMSKDNHLLVLHDIFLDQVTNVRSIFPKRYRMLFGKKRWFAIDFTLAEITKLSMTERFNFNPDTHIKKAVYPKRFPLNKSLFRVHTLEQEIELIQGLNKSTGKNVGIYVEIKSPWFHRHEGRDITLQTLLTLKKYGYKSKKDKVFLQCFDPDALLRIKNSLQPKLGIQLKLVQLIAETSWHETMRMIQGKLTAYDFDWMQTPNGIKKIATYADGIGPWKPMIVSNKSTHEHLLISDLVKNAHKNNLLVHPYTFRNDPGAIPSYARNFSDLLNIFLYTADVDGVFSDYPDLVKSFIKNHSSQHKVKN